MRAVITEAELKKLATASMVIVPRSAIVTPAARDYAREHGIMLAEMGGVDIARAAPREGAGDMVVLAEGMGVPRRAARLSLADEARPMMRPGQAQANMQVEELIVKIARAAIARLGPHTDREILVRVIATVLAHLGYAVGVSRITQQD